MLCFALVQEAVAEDGTGVDKKAVKQSRQKPQRGSQKAPRKDPGNSLADSVLQWVFGGSISLPGTKRHGSGKLLASVSANELSFLIQSSNF